MTVMLRPRWTIEMDGTRARVTFTPEARPDLVESLREWYGRDGDEPTTEPLTMVWNGDDLSDLEIAIRQAREAADAAIWTDIDKARGETA
jgi:hypothetical protein